MRFFVVLDVNKTRIQKRRREKLPVDGVPIGSEQKEEDAKTVEMGPPDWVGEEAEAEPRPDAAERLFVAPTQPAPPPEPAPQLPRDSKCVRISEEPPVTIPSPPRSVPSSSCGPLSLWLRCVNLAFFVFFLFLGFVRTLTPRLPLPSLPLPYRKTIRGKGPPWFS